MFPVLLKFGPITVYSFGVFMALGFYLATEVTTREYQRRGFDGEAAWGFFLWVFLGGLLSSRVLSIFNDLPAFIDNPLLAFAGSGFVWYGGFIGGIGTAWLLSWRRGLALLPLAECASLGLALGQAVGRIGCHVAGDGDWGKVTEVPWGVAYERAIVGWPHEPGILVHPTPLYEATAYFSVFLLIYSLRTKNLPLGTMFCVYMIGNSFSRFWIEFLRIEPIRAFGLTQAQLIAIALFVTAWIWLVKLRATRAQQQPLVTM